MSSALFAANEIWDTGQAPPSDERRAAVLLANTTQTEFQNGKSGEFQTEKSANV